MGDTEFVVERLRQVAVDGLMVLGLVVLLTIEFPI